MARPGPSPPLGLLQPKQAVILVCVPHIDFHKTVLCWDSRETGGEAGENGQMCAIYPAQESVSEILDVAGEKWDRAYLPCHALDPFA